MKTTIASALLLSAGIAAAQQNQNMQRRPPNATEFISQLDQNGDGKVSQNEFDGPSDLFSHLDTNSDGYISQDEVPKGPPGEKNGEPPKHDSKGFIARFDKDGDGQISETEFSGPPGYFKYLDQNSDGYISADEAPKKPTPPPSESE